MGAAHTQSKTLPLSLSLTANLRSRNPPMGHAEKPPPNPRIAPTSRPEPAPPPPPKMSSARRPGTPWRAAQDTISRTCVCGSGNSVGCQYKQDSRFLTDYGNKIDNEETTKIFHSSESNNIDRVMAALITNPNPASNRAVPQVPQCDVYCYCDSADTNQSGAIIMSYVDGCPIGLPVVDEDKHNLTPSGALSIGKAYELKFMHDEVSATPYRSSEERGLGLSSATQMCTDLCISIPTRNRGPAYDPSSKITKRSKVDDNTYSRSKDDSKHTQVSATPYRSSEERGLGLSSATQMCTDLCISIPTRKRGPAHDLSSKITKRSKVDDNTYSRSKDDSKHTQVFVHFGDTCISLQVDPEKTTVRRLILSAMNRKGIRYFDVYLLYCGRVLEETYLLSAFSIPKDASFRVIPRVRAGQDQMLITYKTFDVIIKDMKPFYKVLLPVILRRQNETKDVYMVFLSQAARVLVVQLLIYLSYLHSEDWCFNGRFKITQFIFWNGNAMMHPDVRKVRASGAGCQRDMVKLGEEIERMFKRINFFPTELGQLPGYVNHLVELLKNFPIHKWQSKTYRSYLSNHPGLLSFNERINKYLGTDLQYDFMNANIRTAFSAAVGDFGKWERSICQVGPLFDTYWHNPISRTQSRFASEAVSWLAVGRNFLSHPNEKQRGSGRKSTVPVGFTKEEAEAALAFYWKDNLAIFLLNVVEKFRPPANMDIKLLCGNDLIDPDSRGGKSGGTEVGQVS